MDDFGIGAAVIGSFRILMTAARATGRTTKMIERYQDGDRIVFCSIKHARQAARKAQEQGKILEYTIVDPTTPERLFDRQQSKGKTIFDHFWLELYYQHELAEMTKRIEYFQNNASGPGEPHRKTREAARMINRWN